MSARIAICGLCLTLSGCGGGSPAPPTPRVLLDDLRAHPDRVPAAPPSGTRTVLLAVGLHEGIVHADGNAIPVGGTLGLERGLARRRSHAPKYWVLQTAGGDGLRYWTPLDPSPQVRVNLPVDLEDQSHLDQLVQMPEMYVALRLPFFPQGKVEFYSADGTWAGGFRFGGEPSSPLATEGHP